jgi:hypothetical protein
LALFYETVSGWKKIVKGVIDTDEMNVAEELAFGKKSLYSSPLSVLKRARLLLRSSPASRGKVAWLFAY